MSRTAPQRRRPGRSPQWLRDRNAHLEARTIALEKSLHEACDLAEQRQRFEREVYKLREEKQRLEQACSQALAQQGRFARALETLMRNVATEVGVGGRPTSVEYGRLITALHTASHMVHHGDDDRRP